jgi:hypothetical protein
MLTSLLFQGAVRLIENAVVFRMHDGEARWERAKQQFAGHVGFAVERRRSILVFLLTALPCDVDKRFRRPERISTPMSSSQGSRGLGAAFGNSGLCEVRQGRRLARAMR